MSQQNYVVANHLSALASDLREGIRGVNEYTDRMGIGDLEEQVDILETVESRIDKLAQALAAGTPIPESPGSLGEDPPSEIVTPDHPGTGEAHSSSAQSGVSPGGGGLTPTGGSFENGPSYHAPASQIERGPGNRPVFPKGPTMADKDLDSIVLSREEAEGQPTGGGSGESVPSEVSVPESPTSTSGGQRKSDGVVVSDKPEREFPPVPPIPDPNSNTGGQTI